MDRVFHYSESNNIYYNLALEEYLVRNFDFTNQELLLIYRNEPCVVLGKNQNFFQEVHLDSFFNSNYKLARRISGGGTVVHDLGNVNFAFFEKYDLKNVNQYSGSVGRIVNALNNLDLKASMNERNAIILENGKKISGSAQFSSNKAILSHLTLLFDSNLEMIDLLIQKNPYQLQTKASPSVRSFIDNISNYTDLSQDEFIQKSLSIMGFANTLDNKLIDISQVYKLMTEKYGQLHFYLDISANGIISKNKIEIELENGRILNIKGMNDPSKYIHKRLYPADIALEDSLWTNLLLP
ncbi:MAG: hypothetical protein JNL75_05700 [Chitinophagales bacterium]|nr:hypothetical protein [Chitinophagales bacterium]